ncbi:MAG: hypothetical protein L0170_00165 [Acidobacteria bacterium]|nr:hypothetical protein [Acidobacteriota bacterium]
MSSLAAEASAWFWGPGASEAWLELQEMRGFREQHPDRWPRLERESPGRIVRLAPKVDGAGTVFFDSRKARDLVRWGEEAVLERWEALC